jgi:DNA modification methylase
MNVDDYILEGDCLEWMKRLIDNGLIVQSIVTDPPYHIGFMNRYWDDKKYGIAFNKETWKLCYELLPPGGHLVAFGSTKTYHRLACAIEDSGFEIRDQLAWVYGQAMPHGLNISKAIDKKLGLEQKVVGTKLGRPGYSLRSNDTEDHNRNVYSNFTDSEKECAITEPISEEAKKWEGWNTDLKPCWEPIVLARKPLVGTVVENVFSYNTGGINVNKCRIEPETYVSGGGNNFDAFRIGEDRTDRPPSHKIPTDGHDLGRWPGNLIHDGSDEVVEMLPASKGMMGDVKGTEKSRTGDSGIFGHYNRVPAKKRKEEETSSARFFYCAKTTKKERNGSKHPTIKPVALMRWLVKLITPPDGIVLDPFAGTGTTGEAALLEGFYPILIEKDNENTQDIIRRLEKINRE